MWLKRILWLLTLLLLAACYLFTERIVFAALAIAAALLPLPSLILLRIAARRAELTFQLPESTEKGEPLNVEIVLSGSAILSAMRVHIQLQANNLLTGEVQSMKANLDSDNAVLCLNSPHCGRLLISARQLRIRDPLGLFQQRKKLGSEASILIMPNTFEPMIELQSPDFPDMESDDYSMTSPGDDPSELFDIRDYREGDSLRSIHWKLSGKYDRTVVKEMSQPVSNALLLLLDNCPTADFSADAADRACEALVSVSQTLADQSITHQIAWFNRDTAQMEVVSITSLDDLSGEKARILSAGIAHDDEGILSRMLTADELTAARRILLFAPTQPVGTGAMEEKLTVLLPEDDPEGAISCLPEHMTRLLV